MLLCCFKEPKKAKGQVEDEADAPYTKAKKVGSEVRNCKRLSVSEDVATLKLRSGEDLATLKGARLQKEKAPLAKEEKRLLKQKSRESVTRLMEANSLPYIDQSPKKQNVDKGKVVKLFKF